MYQNPYWFNRKWLLLYLFPLILIYLISDNIHLTAILFIGLLLSLFPFYIWFGNIARCIETTTTGIIAYTYNKKIIELTWYEIKDVKIKHHRWFSFYDYIYVYSLQKPQPLIFCEVISDHDVLIKLLYSKTGVSEISHE